LPLHASISSAARGMSLLYLSDILRLTA
jgi:hypothetical protein